MQSTKRTQRPPASKEVHYQVSTSQEAIRVLIRNNDSEVSFAVDQASAVRFASDILQAVDNAVIESPQQPS